MSSWVSVRDLRNHAGDVLRRVQEGETVTITSAGAPVAEIRPLPSRQLSTRELIAERRGWPEVHPRQMRDEIDAVIDQTI
jgi:prevent-host-death family protein